MARISL